jgi:hypothetical protein
MLYVSPPPNSRRSFLFLPRPRDERRLAQLPVIGIQRPRTEFEGSRSGTAFVFAKTRLQSPSQISTRNLASPFFILCIRSLARTFPLFQNLQVSYRCYNRSVNTNCVSQTPDYKLPFTARIVKMRRLMNQGHRRFENR